MNRLEKIKNEFHTAKHGEVHGDTDIDYLLSIIELQNKALNDAKTALDDQYLRDGGIIQNNKAYMAIFNALQAIRK